MSPLGYIFDRAGFSQQAVAFLRAEIRPRRWKFSAFLVLSVVAALIELTGVGLVFPLLMILVSPDYIDRFGPLSSVIDSLGIGRGLAFSLLLVGVIALMMVGKNLYMLFFTWVQFRLLANWKTVMSARIMTMYIYADYSLHLVKNSSEIIRNLALTTAVYDHVIAGLISLFVNGVVLIGLILLLLFIVPHEAAYGIAGILAVVVVLYRAMRRPFADIGREQNVLFEKRQNILRQSIGMFKETKIAAKERFFLDSFCSIERRTFLKTAHNNFLSTVPSLVIEGAVILAVLILVSYILFLSPHPGTGLAILGLLAATLFRMMPLLNRMLSSLQLISLGSDSVEILARELGELESKIYVPREEPPPLAFEREVELADVSFIYPTGEEPAIKNISLSIVKNEIVGITGASGSGKSTLASIVMALISPTSGEIRVDGVPLREPSQIRGWHRHLGYVAQSVYLVEDTIARNIALGQARDEVDEEQLWRVLETVQLKDFVKSLPDGIHHFIGEDGTRLSGGQRQRLGIARALYLDPNVLILDEATSALDVAIERAFSDNLARLKHTRTLVIIAHRLSTLRGCDRIVMLDNGRVLDVAPFDELESRCAPFRRLVSLSRLDRVS